MRPSLLITLILTALALAVPANAQTLILSAVPDLAAGTVTITGAKLAKTDVEPVVTLGGDPLTIVSFSETEIVALLPAVPAGTYLLTVAPRPSQFDEADLALILQGPPGTPGISGYEVTSTAFGGSGDITGTQSCSPGKKVLGGGCWVSATLPCLLSRSSPGSDNESWTCTCEVEDFSSKVMTVYAICANVSVE